MKIEFLGPINLDSIEISAQNLAELKTKLSEIKELKTWLPLCAIALNDEIITDKSVVFKNSDKISLLPPVCGG